MHETESSSELISNYRGNHVACNGSLTEAEELSIVVCNDCSGGDFLDVFLSLIISIFLFLTFYLVILLSSLNW